jgi:hypothetical protein
MAVHFIHIRKTGGSAIKFAIRSAGRPPTPYGPLRLHKHQYTLRQVPPGDLAFFFLRDPISRFVSGFYSRLRKGQPRLYVEWTPAEQEAFTTYATPQHLAEDLADGRRTARKAMNSIGHVRHRYEYWLGEPRRLAKKLDQILFIGRQETLGDDWLRLRSLLDLPPDLDLPTDPVIAHRGLEGEDRTLSERQASAIKRWYRSDYRILEFCDEVRHGLGPGSG